MLRTVRRSWRESRNGRSARKRRRGRSLSSAVRARQCSSLSTSTVNTHQFRSYLQLAYPCPLPRPLPPLHIPGRQSTYSLGVKARPAHYPAVWEDSTITIAAHLTSGMVHRTWQAESQVHEGTSLVRSSFPRHTSVEEEVILSTRVREAWICFANAVARSESRHARGPPNHYILKRGRVEAVEYKGNIV